MEDHEQELQLVRILRSHLLPFHPDLENVDSSTLRRFLRARSHNIEKASEMFLHHVKWRREFAPNGYISESEIFNELKTEKLFMQGLDKKGRLIAVYFAESHVTSRRNLEAFKKFVVYSFDKAVVSLTGEQEKFIIIADLKNWNLQNMDIKGYLGSLEILQDHYPERLGKLFILHSPNIFSFAWKIVSPFIDPVVKEKIIFLKDNNIKETLLSDIDISQLPKTYGGDLPLVPIQHFGNK